MQEETRAKESFLERTDLLAKELNVSLRNLAPIIGISSASLFGYRSGNIAISSKAWSKLEYAEHKAGVESSVGEDAVSYGKANNPRLADPLPADYFTKSYFEIINRMSNDELVSYAEELQEEKPPGYENALNKIIQILRKRIPK